MEFTNILKKGSKGNDVREMQTMLIACGFSCGSDGADGDFGKNTLASLTAFQTANGLEAIGIFDADTWAALEHELKYKQNMKNPELIAAELKRCADELAACDVSMQTIRDLIRS